MNLPNDNCTKVILTCLVMIAFIVVVCVMKYINDKLNR